MKNYFLLPFLFLSCIAYAVKVDTKTPEASQGFIENKGQIHDQHNKPNRDVLYLLNTNGLNVQIKKGGFAYDTYVIEKKIKERVKSDVPAAATASDSIEYIYKYHRIDIGLLGANTNAEVIAESPSNDYTNYYNVPYAEQGILQVRSFKKVTLKNIYAGIDVEYMVNDGNFKYNFIVHPGADYKQIQVKYEGAPLTLVDNKLQFAMAQGTMEERIPKSWYENEGGKTQVVSVAYQQVNKNTFGFSGVKENIDQTLVIDPNPFRLWGTYYGGINSEADVVTCATDGIGNVFLAGTTTSTNNIATSGSFQSIISGNTDAFLIKFSTSGTRLWGTYYGGAGFDAVGVKLAIDATGSTYLPGLTTSLTNISTAGSHQTTLAGGGYDAFLVRFDSAGIRQWATYYGGSGSETNGVSCALDVSGNLILAGITGSNNNISTPASHQAIPGGNDDVFLVKFNSFGSRLWGTYYGGSNNEEFGASVVTDASGNIYLAGITRSTTNISTVASSQPAFGGGTHDAFLVKFNSSGVRQWATYFGGSSDETNGISCTVDAIGNIIISGITSSNNGIASAGSHQTIFGGNYDSFLAKYDTNGIKQWSTYYGGSLSEYGGIGVSSFVDTSNNIFLAGVTQSNNNISTSGVYQFASGGDYDAFLVKFNNSGVRLWGTYYGGAASEFGNLGLISSAIDPTNSIYLAGATASADNISSSGSHQPTFGGGGSDFFLVKFQECSSGTLGTMTTISPPSPATVCSGAARTFSLSAAVTNAVGYNWTVPAGWTIVSGQGTLNLTAIPTTTGTLSVRAYNSCGDSSTTAATRSVTVTASPAKPSVITTSQGQLVNGVRTFCNGTSASFSVTNVAGNTYQWTMPSGWTGTTSTTNTITRTVGTVSDTIQVIAVSTTTACPSDTQKLYVRSFQIPATPLSIIGNTTVCIGKQNAFSLDSVSFATSYTWTIPSGWTFGSVSKTDSSIITPTPTSALGNITVIARNFCGASSARTLNISTNTSVPAQPSAISGSTSVCGNSTQTYSVTAVSGVKYRWVLPTGWRIQSGDSTNQITVFTGTVGGTISVFPYLASVNICEGTARSLTVTMLTTPNKPGLISGDTTVCVSGVNNYTISAVPNATSYVWTLPSGWTGTSSTTSITATAGSSTGNMFLRVRAVNGSCSSLDTSLGINVSPAIGVLSNITGNTTVCAGSIQQYSISSAVNTTNYTWSFPSGWIPSGKQDTNSIRVVSGTTTGTISIVATNLGCSATKSFSVTTVNTKPSVPSTITTSQGQLINGVRTICNATSATFAVTNVSGNTYQWFMPTGWTGSASTTNTITSIVGTSSDTIRVLTLSSSSCPSDTQKLFVRSFQIPTTPLSIIGNATVCTGKQNAFSVDSVAYATSYTWTLPGGWTFGSVSKTDSSIILPTPNSATGSLNVVARNFCGVSNQRSLPITTNTSSPVQPSAISGSTSVCGNSTQTYSVVAVAGVRYRWVLPPGWVLQSGDSTNQITVITGTVSGVISVYPYQLINPICEGTPQTLSVSLSNTAPAKPGLITGDTTVCAGDVVVYSISAVPNATSYVWTLPSGAGWSGSSTSTSINITSGTVAGNFKLNVRALSGGCSSLDTSLTVNVSLTIGTVSNITGNTTVCAGSTQQFSIVKPANATKFNWTLPSGWTFNINQDSNSVSATVGSASGTVSVVAANLGCSSPAKTLTVTVNAAPALGAIIGNSPICPGVSTTYSVSASGATTFAWTKNLGWTGTSTTNTITITPNSVSDTLRVVASNGTCNSVERKLYISVSLPPAIPAQILGTTLTCVNSTEQFRVAKVTGATSYKWTYPTGWSGSSATTDSFVYVTVGNTSGALSVASVNNIGCTSTTRNSNSVTVSTTIPSAPTTINGGSSYCPQVSKIISVPSVTGATGYLWTVPSGWAINSGQNTSSITVTPNANTGIISVQTVQGGCKSGIIQSFMGTARTKPGQSVITLSGGNSPCANTSITLSCTPVSDADSYTWSLPSGWSLTSVNGGSNVTALVGSGGGNITVLTANDGCSGTQSTKSVTVSTPPVVTGKIEGETYIKSNTIRKYYVSGVTGAASYNWSVAGTGWSILSGANEDTLVVYSGKSAAMISVDILNTCGSINKSKNVFAGVSSGLTESELFSSSTVYPIPASNNFTLNFSLRQQSTLEWEIVNMLGQQISRGITGALQGGVLHELPFSSANLSTGMYQLNITNGSYTECIKLSIIK